MKIAVIPARGGSKRIPKKNIKHFLGKPMIERTIQCALESNIFSEVIVSTDDQEIADISKAAGAKVPFKRSEKLSDDETPTAPVVKDTLLQLDKEKYQFCCCIYPCTPLLEINDLKKALDLLISHDANFCYPITEFSHPIQRALFMRNDDTLAFSNPETELTPTQKLDKFYHDCGQFYWGRYESWVKGLNMHSNNAVGFKIPNWRIVDIDNEEDWTRAELLFDVIKNKEKRIL